MTDLPAPEASRLRRPSWTDARLVIGVLLVLVSTALGSLAVAHAGDTAPVYAARGVLVAGQAITASDVRRVDVRLGDGGAAYLSAADDLPPDAFVLREVREGELVPASAVGSRADVAHQPVTLPVEATSAGSLTAGSVVDVYVNRPDPDGVASVGATAYAGPDRVLEAVSVLRVSGDDGVLGSGATTRAVQVFVPRDAVADLVADVDAGSKITLVPVPGSPLGEPR